MFRIQELLELRTSRIVRTFGIEKLLDSWSFFEFRVVRIRLRRWVTGGGCRVFNLVTL